MRIRLTETIREGGQVKMTVREKRGVVIGWFSGVEIEVSEATGRKFIEAGKAVAVDEVTQ